MTQNYRAEGDNNFGVRLKILFIASRGFLRVWSLKMCNAHLQVYEKRRDPACAGPFRLVRFFRDSVLSRVIFSEEPFCFFCCFPEYELAISPQKGKNASFSPYKTSSLQTLEVRIDTRFAEWGPCHIFIFIECELHPFFVQCAQLRPDYGFSLICECAKQAHLACGYNLTADDRSTVFCNTHVLLQRADER